MKIYITCPFSHSRKRLGILSLVEKIVKSKGFEVIVPKIGGTPKEIFERDYKWIKSSDLIIAEVSELSHGVGMEIGLSYCLGLKRILLLEKGNKVTKFAHGMPDTYIIEYNNIKDLEEKLSELLKKI